VVRKNTGIASIVRAARLVLGVLLLLLGPAPRAAAQGAPSATLRGTIVDASGGVLPGATVTLTSIRTRAVRTGQSDAVGGYVFVALTPGPYRLSVSLSGFEPWESSEIHLSPGDSLQVDATLALAGHAEEVTVTAERQMVRLDQGAREGLITSDQIQDLSIISRGAMELLRILPGTVIPEQAAMERVGFYNGGNDYAWQSVNGMRGTTLSPVLDGAKLTDTGANNGVIVNMNPDMVEEVKVQAGNFSAEYGSPGLQVTAVTKGGGASFHGSLYDYWRSWRLAANDRSRNYADLPRPKNDYQYPGFNLSGPVLLPGTDFNRGRDKLFFFVGFEYQHQVIDPGTYLFVTPTEAQRRGDFSALLSGQGQNLAQPTVVTIPWGFPGAGTPAPNNDLSPYLDPMGRAFLSMYPLPNYQDPDNRYNYVYDILRPHDRWQLATRLDWNVTRSTHAHARVAVESETIKASDGPFATSNFALPSRGIEDTRGWSAAANVTSVLSPRMTNELTLAASRIRSAADWEDPERMSLAALGLEGYQGMFPNAGPYAPVEIVSAGQDLGGLFALGGMPIDWWSDSYSLADNLSQVVGTHTLEAGVFVERARKLQFNPYVNGLFLLAGPWTAGGTGNDYGDLAVGRLFGFSQQTPSPRGEFRFWNFEGYLQDSWKVRRNLTLEAGLRVSKMPNNRELTGLALRFEPSAYDPSQGSLIDGDPQRPNGVLLARRGEIPNGMTDDPGVKLMPRLNFAWDAKGDAGLIVRGGAGLFYSRPMGNCQQWVANAPPNSYGAQVFWYDVGGLTLSDLPTIDPWSRVGAASVTSLDPDSVALPRTWNWSLAVAKRLPWSQTLELAYVGHRADDLPNRTLLNYIEPGTLTGSYGNADLDNPRHRAALAPPVVASFRSYPAYNNSSQWYQFEAWSRYHALQATLSRSVGKRFQYFVNYTFGRVRGTVGDDYTVTDPLEANRRSTGVAPQDRPHIFNASYNLRLPDPIGEDGNGLLRHVLDGWQLSGITSYRSGMPFQLRLTGDIGTEQMALAWWGTDAHGSNDRVPFSPVAPIILGDPREGGADTGDRILDPSQIAIPDLGESGPFDPPYDLRLPGRWNFDLTLFKNFDLGGTKRLQLRIGFFNLFNQAAPVTVDDIDLTLRTVCNVHVNGVPNGAGGTTNGVCDPSGGFHFDDLTLQNFGRIITKRGHRVIELAARFEF
jgi:hypothetical protein